jgi:uncharacterized membrane protein
MQLTIIFSQFKFPFFQYNQVLIFSLIFTLHNFLNKFMNKTRLEAFSDGVIAIIITIMVLSIAVPDQANWTTFLAMLPNLLGYALSFVFIGIYWNNHHHLLHAAEKVTASIMWANHNLLFWLSLVPLATAWMSKTQFQTFAVVTYSSLLLICGGSYSILSHAILNSLSKNNPLRTVLEKFGFKEMCSIICYSLAIPAAFWHTYISMALFLFVSIVWLIPSREIEKKFEEKV